MPNKPENERLYWSTEQAAHYISFSHDTLYRWAKNATSANPKKKLGKYPAPIPPCIRFGRTFRFPIIEFKRWAQNPNNVQFYDQKASVSCS